MWRDESEDPAVSFRPLCFGYCRISTVRQAREGLSIEGQQEDILRHFNCYLKGKYAWGGMFIDDMVTGKIPLRSRPMGSDLFARVERGDAIIIAKLDRAFYSLKNALETIKLCRARKIFLVLLDLAALGLGDEATLGVVRGFAAFERTRLGEQARAGKAALKARGAYQGGPPKYGTKVVLRNGRRALVPHHGERAIGKKIVEWRAKNPPWSWGQIVSHLMSHRVKTKTGADYHKSTVQRHHDAELRLQAQERAAAGGAGA
jgi:putative DNA-invertase from lambdoid prophage Rac